VATGLIYTAKQAITITLANKATGVVQRSASVSMSSQNFVEVIISLIWKSGASSTSATGYVSAYLYTSGDDGTTFTAGGNTDAVYTLKGDELSLGSPMAAIANATTYSQNWSVVRAFGTVPRDFGVIIANNSGGTSDTTSGNFVLNYQGIKYG